MSVAYTNQRSYSASVIVPTYNRQHLLELTLASLGRQTGPYSYEVIVCDDGSSDGTFEVVRKAQRGANIKYVYYAKDGYRPTRARNMGLRLAEGDVAIFLDCGNLPSTRFVANHVAAHLAGRVGVVGYLFGARVNNDSDQLLLEKLDVGDIDGSIERMKKEASLDDMREDLFAACGDRIEQLQTSWGLFHGGNISALTEDARSVGGFDEGYARWSQDDIDFGLCLKRIGVKLVLSRDAAAIQYPHSKNQAARACDRAFNRRYLAEKYHSAEVEALMRLGSTRGMILDELTRIGLK